MEGKNKVQLKSWWGGVKEQPAVTNTGGGLTLTANTLLPRRWYALEGQDKTHEMRTCVFFIFFKLAISIARTLSKYFTIRNQMDINEWDQKQLMPWTDNIHSDKVHVMGNGRTSRRSVINASASSGKGQRSHIKPAHYSMFQTEFWVALADRPRNDLIIKLLDAKHRL